MFNVYLNGFKRYFKTKFYSYICETIKYNKFLTIKTKIKMGKKKTEKKLPEKIVKEMFDFYILSNGLKNDRNIEERKKVFFGGVSSLYTFLTRGVIGIDKFEDSIRDNKKASETMLSLFNELKDFWEEQTAEYEAMVAKLATRNNFKKDGKDLHN